MDPDRLLDGLDPSQRRAVASDAAPLAILAGAGSGKTRVLTRRIAHRCATGAADPRHVLAITFTRKAAQELDGRLRTLGLRDLPAAGTFHAVAYAQLRTRWAASGTAAPTLLDRKGRLLARILGGTTRVNVGDLATEIEWAKARLVHPDRYPVAAAQADRRLAVPPERVAGWYARYEEEKRRRGLVDFDDLLDTCATAIEGDPAFAAAQRWRFRHLFVDEYQDLNPLQERLLRAWLGDGTDLTVVGDPDQAIYGWNGADATYLRDFATHHPGAEVIRLEHNYRSTPQIAATAAAVLGGGDAGRAPAVTVHRPDGPPPAVVGYATDRDEANAIARAVHDHHAPGRPWSAQAVLVRTNAQAAVIEEVFRRAAIPCAVRGRGAVLDEPSVKDLLRSFDRSRDPLATTLADLETRLHGRRRDLAALDDPTSDDPMSEEAAADDALDDPDEDDPTDEDDATVDGEARRARWAPTVDERRAAGREVAALESIVRLGRDLLVVDPTARTEDFSGWLRTTLQDEDPHRDAVAISSFHAAKGLEWSVVHVAGLEAGLVPITHARTAEDRAEERRLLYVAVTRAQDVLRCTWAAQRTFGDRTVDRQPSPYLAWLRDASVALAADQRHAGDPRAALAATRAELARHDPHDGGADASALRAALREWRAGEAAKARVQPTVVLTDRAVEDLVRDRPADADALAAVGDVAPAIRERHGARLLAIIAEHP